MDEHIAIRSENLTKRLGSRTVLRGLDLAIAAGECVVLSGENGSGKTTLLRCLAGLARLDSGRVWWFVDSPANPAAHRLIGMVSHESHLYPNLTLRENLVLSGRLYGVDAPKARAAFWLDAAGLGRHADRLPREVSQGMRRRAALARASLHEPPILLLDEPFSALDRAGREWVQGLLRDRREAGQTTCLVTHEGLTTLDFVDRELHLQAGRLWEINGLERKRIEHECTTVA